MHCESRSPCCRVHLQKRVERSTQDLLVCRLGPPGVGWCWSGPTLDPCDLKDILPPLAIGASDGIGTAPLIRLGAPQDLSGLHRQYTIAYGLLWTVTSRMELFRLRSCAPIARRLHSTWVQPRFVMWKSRRLTATMPVAPLVAECPAPGREAAPAGHHVPTRS